ncbi:hypothetical protein BV20DRAFT_1121871 [Pilatotrama ljubarskyi]|nr:hypothetical protein BV20DRAFT_1121871 [Pilatotrama ljubarskyi]
MATRPNKKRKGRSNAPPRERTVTTLTDGPDSAFPAHSQLSPDDSPAPAILSPPFAVGSPLSPAGPPVLSAAPYPLQPFSGPFPYSFNMSPVARPPFHPQHSPPHFYPAQPQPIPQPSPAHHALPPGQSDLEILERLKETIKNNQHELFRPIPQPAALASVYLGPKPALSSHVPPHPEQVPTDDVSPPGLNLLPHGAAAAAAAAAKANSDVSSANVLNQATSRVPHQSPRDNTRKPPHRSSVSESPKINTSQPSRKRTNDRYDAPPSAKYDSSASAVSNIPGSYTDTNTSPTMGPPGLQRLEQASGKPPSPDKGLRRDVTESPAAPGEPPPAKLSPPKGREDLRPRDPAWGSRGNLDDRQHRNDVNRAGGRVSESPRPGNLNAPNNANGNGHGNDVRPLPPRDQRIVDRDRERERDRERDKDRDFERDRGRQPPREEPNRFREDRRNDDRPPRPADNRRPSPDSRRYEPRYPPRRYDSKASEGSFTSPRLADKSPPEPRPIRNLGEERAIVRPPADVAAPRPSAPDERRPPPPVVPEEPISKQPPPVDDRRLPVSSASVSDRQLRVNDDRRPPPPPAAAERLTRPPEDRRPPPAAVYERSGTSADDRRRPPSPDINEKIGRTMDDRRAPVPPSPAMSLDRRPVDDRRPAPPAVDRYVPTSSSEDRRPPVSAERAPRAGPEERRAPPLEERISRTPIPSLLDSVPARPTLEDRNARTDDRNARPPVPLEERISRAPPSLHERLSLPPVRQDDRSVPRLEDRLSRPANAPPSLEERLSTPAALEERPLRPPPSDDRPPRPPLPPVERPVARPVDDRTILAEPARPPPPTERAPAHAQDRVFTPADRFTRPATPAGSDRAQPPPPRSYRAPSVARDEPRSFRPPSPGRSPARSDVREFRPVGEPRDRLSYRPGPGPGPGPEQDRDRYASERRAAPAPPPGPDLMDVDPLHPRAPESRLSYRRPSPPPPPADPYPPRDRAWVPAGEAAPYREPEPARRMAADPHAREWRDGERPYEEWNDRSWERGREYDRDARFVEREAVPPAWETREERERRAAYPPDVPPPPPPARAYERPLSARLTDAYPDERAYLDRGRYGVELAPAYSRVRPRSPSPLRRSGASDDMRPPLKRAREDPYAAGPYYPEEPPRGGPVEYAPRMRTPPPPPSSAYYDDPRYPASPGGRERDYLDPRDRDVPGYAPYDRRADPGPRMPPPRSPAPYARSAYGRDDRRY